MVTFARVARTCLIHQPAVVEIHMTELRFSADIQAPADSVFSLLAELRDYARWLPTSSAYRGTQRISDGPIGLGTTYVEQSPLGVRHGIVTAFEPPCRLDFEQPMTLRPRIIGVIGIRLAHRLTTDGKSPGCCGRSSSIHPARYGISWGRSSPHSAGENDRMLGGAQVLRRAGCAWHVDFKPDGLPFRRPQQDSRAAFGGDGRW